MSEASPEQLLRTTKSIKQFIRERQSEPFSDETGEYLTYIATLERPRHIGARIANHLRLVESLSGSIIVGAQYRTEANVTHPITGLLQEFPIRNITIKGEAPATYSFNGTSIDANEYPLSAEMVEDLIFDVQSAN